MARRIANDPLMPRSARSCRCLCFLPSLGRHGRNRRVSDQSATSRVIVFQDRRWFLDPRLGAVAVFVDGHREGVAPVDGELVVRVAPGEHVVRIRAWWWYRSPVVAVTVADGQGLRLRADVPQELGMLARFTRCLFSPWRCLTLTPIGAAD